MIMYSYYDLFYTTVRAAQELLSDLRIFLCKSVLYGAFVWARRALKHQKRRFPARADELYDEPQQWKSPLAFGHGRTCAGQGDPDRGFRGSLEPPGPLS